MEENDASLLQLPLPCINSSATRIYFGRERQLADGNAQLIICI